MKLVKISFWIVVFVAIPVLSAKEITLGDTFLKRASDDQLYEKLRSLKRQGYAIKGSTPESTQRINIVYDSIGKGEAGWREAVKQLKQTVGAPMGSGGVATGMQGVVSAGSDQSSSSGFVPSPPSQGGVPGAPPPPPSGIVTGAGQASGNLSVQLAATAKPKEPIVYVLPELSAGELRALSSSDKVRSDEVLSDLVKVCAQEFFIGDQKKVAPETPRLVAPNFKDAFVAYQFFIKDRLIARVGQNDAFKNREKLSRFIGSEAEDGLFFKFIKSNLSIKRSLDKLYKDVSSQQGDLLQLFAGQFKSLFFNDDAWENLKVDFDVMMVNLIASQRRMLTALGPARSVSDGLIIDLFTELIEILEKEIPSEELGAVEQDVGPDLDDDDDDWGDIDDDDDDDSPQNRSFNMAAFKKDLISGMNLAIGESVVKQEQEKKVIFNLSQDYIDWLHRRLNHLRVHPSFLHFAWQKSSSSGVQSLALVGKATRDYAGGLSSEIDKLSSYPLLEMLRAPEEKYFTLNNFRKACADQLLFVEGEELKRIMNDEKIIINGMLNYHVDRMQQQRRAGVNTYDFLSQKLQALKANKKLKKGIEKRDGLLSVLSVVNLVADEEAAQHILAARKALQVDDIQLPEVLVAFNAIGDKALSSGDQKVIADIVHLYNKEQAQRAEIIALLKQAKSSFDSNGKPNDALLKSGLQKIGVPGRSLKVFDNPKRNPQMIRNIFIGLLGSTQGVAEIKEDTFYKLITPYGVLVEVIMQAPATKAAEGEGRLDVFVNSLRVLNNGQKAPKESYVPAIDRHIKIIKAGVYKGKLNNIVKAASEYNIGGVIDGVRDFVSQASKLAAANSAFKKALSDLTDFLVASIMADIIDQLKDLDEGRGEMPLPGLYIEGSTYKERQRNNAVYFELVGLFKLLRTPLLKDGKPIAGADVVGLDLDTYKQVLQQAKDAIKQKIDESTVIRYLPEKIISKVNQQKAIIDVFTAYLDNVLKQLGYLKKSAQATAPTSPGGTDIASGELGGPPPPPPPPF